MHLDFSEVKEAAALAEGKNLLSIVGAKEGTSQNGTHMLVLDLKSEEGGFVRDNVCLEGAGAFRTQQLIKALGISHEEFEGMEASDLIGSSVEVEITYEEYNGEQRARVKKYLAA